MPFHPRARGSPHVCVPAVCGDVRCGVQPPALCRGEQPSPQPFCAQIQGLPPAPRLQDNISPRAPRSGRSVRGAHQSTNVTSKHSQETCHSVISAVKTTGAGPGGHACYPSSQEVKAGESLALGKLWL